MIAPSDAAFLVERMAQLQGFPKDQPAALKELRLALECADSIEIARQVVTDVIGYESFAPKPAELRKAVYELHEKQKTVVPVNPPTPKNHCARCQGFGYYGGHLAGKYAGPWKWCDCENGKRARFETPELMNESNANREKLLRRFAVSMKKHGTIVEPELKHAVDEYHGDF